MKIIENKFGCDFYDDINSHTDYQRVSCEFYDELAELSTLKKFVNLVTNTESISGTISDLYTKDKEEFVEIANRHIRLDQILRVEF